MRVGVVCVGTELLLGDIVNSNAAWIGRALADAGLDCLRHVTVGDNEGRIAASVKQVLDDADGVVVTGGLGPTQDDVTREAIASLVGRALVRDEAMEDAIRKRFGSLRRPMPEINLRQADRPEGASTIAPVIGTAPGLIIERDGKPIYLVPGVPAEMREMMQRAVLPDLATRAGERTAIVSRIVRCTGVAESALAETLAPVWDELGSGDVTMAFLAGGGEVRIRLTAKSPTRERADALLERAASTVCERLGAAVFGFDDQTLETVVLALLTEHGFRIACAESLTGGSLGARITDASGASQRFSGSIVAYTNDAKRALLGVPDDVLATDGAVSAACVEAMASGAVRAFGSEIGVATTGVAGPDRQEGVSVGTVFVAVAGPRGTVSREVHLPGDRETIRRMTTTVALNLVRLYLQESLA